MLGSSDQSAAYAAYFGMAFSFAHFINSNGGPMVMEAYRRHFEATEQLPKPRGSIGIFVICAETQDEAIELRWSRDLWTLRLRTGKTGPVPTVEEAKSYPYTDQEWAIVQSNRSRTIAGDPEQCATEIRKLGEVYEVEEFVIVTICDDFNARRHSYELLAEAFALGPAKAA